MNLSGLPDAAFNPARSTIESSPGDSPSPSTQEPHSPPQNTRLPTHSQPPTDSPASPPPVLNIFSQHTAHSRIPWPAERHHCPEPRTIGSEGSCLAHAIATMMDSGRGQGVSWSSAEEEIAPIPPAMMMTKYPASTMHLSTPECLAVRE